MTSLRANCTLSPPPSRSAFCRADSAPRLDHFFCLFFQQLIQPSCLRDGTSASHQDVSGSLFLDALPAVRWLPLPPEIKVKVKINRFFWREAVSSEKNNIINYFSIYCMDLINFCFCAMWPSSVHFQNCTQQILPRSSFSVNMIGLWTKPQQTQKLIKQIKSSPQLVFYDAAVNSDHFNASQEEDTSSILSIV